MGVKLLSYACLLAVSTYGKGDKNVPEPFGKNNPNDVPDGDVFYPRYGGIAEVYKTEHEVRNLLVPISGYGRDYNFLTSKKSPAIYFNLVDEGKNLGQYVFVNDTLHKINDGRDAAADHLKSDKDENVNKNIYIGAPDGIYIYDPDTGNVEKYGSLTEDILAIDKVIGKDEIYILAGDHKIYRVTERGTEKTQVEGIEYAKDFVLDLLEAIYFIGEDNKPQFLIKGKTEPLPSVQFDFEVVNPILGRTILIELDNQFFTLFHSVPFIVDGVLYGLYYNSAVPIYSNRVPGLTAFNAEFSWMYYYAVNGVISKQNLLMRENEDNTKQASRKNNSSRRIAFDRDVRADYENYKKARH